MDDSPLVAQASGGQAEFEPEFGEVVAAHVPEFDPLLQVLVSADAGDFACRVSS